MPEARAAPPAPYRRDHRAMVGSTNAEALAAVAAGAPSGLWVTADEQQTGRGRRGRQWISPPGNLYASLALVEPGPRAVSATLSFVAALALDRAIVDLGGPEVAGRLRLKWPNDLLLDGFKISGILLEREALADGREAVVIGIGVNCLHHPETTAGHPASSLAARGFRIGPEALFGRLSARLAAEIARWDEGLGFGDIRRDWLSRALGVGEAITVRLSDSAIEGRFEALDEEGRLVLLEASGARRVVSAGEIFFAGTGG